MQPRLGWVNFWQLRSTFSGIGKFSSKNPIFRSEPVWPFIFFGIAQVGSGDGPSLGQLSEHFLLWGKMPKPFRGGFMTYSWFKLRPCKLSAL